MRAHPFLLPFIFAIVPLGIVGLLYVLGVGFDAYIPLPNEAEGQTAAEQLLALAGTRLQALDSIVSMLVTLAVGLFVLVGFVIQRCGWTNCLHSAEAVASIVFVSAAFSSVYFGYSARLEAFISVDAGAGTFRHVAPLVGWQATCLLVASSVALFLCARLVMTCRGSELDAV